jgi:CxC2 like cysteine cluster associated with KDZ transposases
MWNGLFFQRTTLRDQGLRIQLGHAYNRACPTRLAAHSNFRVIHSNGIHHVAIDQCRCQNVDLHVQLLRIGWWPATPLDPKSAATFEVLRHFHLLNLQGKVTGYSFYQALEYQTDNTGLDPPPVCPALILPLHYFSSRTQDRLETFMLIVREWRHTKMLKRAGRAFDPGGVCATAPGSLAIPCRACPLPNINLPKGWEHVPPERAYVL